MASVGFGIWDMKQCKRCNEIKPIGEFMMYKKRGKTCVHSMCRECESAHARERYHSNKRKSNSGNRVFLDKHESYRALVVGIIYTAFQDGLGVIESNGSMTQETRMQIVMDGRRFFDDGRFQHLAEQVDGISPDWKPVWRRK